MLTDYAPLGLIQFLKIHADTLEGRRLLAVSLLLKEKVVEDRLSRALYSLTIYTGKILAIFVSMFTSDRYSYSTNHAHLDFEFESVGKKGVIKKVARFSKIGQNLYTFGFGDLNEQTGEISDTVVSNNGDGDKVLRTTAGIIYDFTGFYTGALVFIKGSTPARTRIYQMGINKFWDEINPHFEVWGRENDQWHPFEKGKQYEAFLGRRKAPFYFTR